MDILEKLFNACRLIFILVISLISACSTQVEQQLPEFTIEVKEPKRMRFYGKGAGAGMMLMSSMGPMGVAVGVAIDEGIGKDINKAAVEAGFSIERTLREALINNAPKTLGCIQTVTIDRYGFITQPGDDDPVTPQLHLTFTFINTETLSVKYPEQLEQPPICTLPLAQSKENGEAVIQCFRNAARQYLTAVESI